MTSLNCILFEVGNDLDLNKFKKLLTRILQTVTTYEIDQVDGYYRLTFGGGFKALGCLQASFKAAHEDLNTTFKALIVPFIDNRFTKYLEYVDNGSIKYLFEVGQEHQDVYNDNLDLLDNIDIYTLNTVKAYIEAGNSPSLASYKLYVHRNTVTYRVDRFVQDIGIDLKIFPNVVFVYFLISKKIGDEVNMI